MLKIGFKFYLVKFYHVENFRSVGRSGVQNFDQKIFKMLKILTKFKNQGNIYLNPSNY